MFFDLDDLARAVKITRTEAGISQTKLAEIAGISPTSLNKIEQCAAPNPSLRTVLKILWALDLDIRVVELDERKPTLHDLRREQWLEQNGGNNPVVRRVALLNSEAVQRRKERLYDALRQASEHGSATQKQLAKAATQTLTSENIIALLKEARGTVLHQMLLETLASIGVESIADGHQKPI